MARIKDYDKLHVVAYFASSRTHDGRLSPTWHLNKKSAEIVQKPGTGFDENWSSFIVQ
jgi:hypothetical protein